MKSLIRITMAIAVLAPLAVMTAAPAGAAAVLTCTTQAGSATIKPGITPKATNVTITVKEKFGEVQRRRDHERHRDRVVREQGSHMRRARQKGHEDRAVHRQDHVEQQEDLDRLAHDRLERSDGYRDGQGDGRSLRRKEDRDDDHLLPKTGNCTSTPLTALTIKGTKPFVIS